MTGMRTKFAIAKEDIQHQDKDQDNGNKKYHKHKNNPELDHHKAIVLITESSVNELQQLGMDLKSNNDCGSPKSHLNTHIISKSLVKDIPTNSI